MPVAWLDPQPLWPDRNPPRITTRLDNATKGITMTPPQPTRKDTTMKTVSHEEREILGRFLTSAQLAAYPVWLEKESQRVALSAGLGGLTAGELEVCAVFGIDPGKYLAFQQGERGRSALTVGR
jgi:hypothetical protein